MNYFKAFACIVGIVLISCNPKGEILDSEEVDPDPIEEEIEEEVEDETVSFNDSDVSYVNEALFFSDLVSEVSAEVDLVADYFADGTDTVDDSAKLQKAIDDMTQLPNGGVVNIPEGTFYLINISLKSNVHIKINSKATIVPPTNNGTIFRMGLSGKGIEATELIENVSIRGVGGRFTVDLSSGDPVIKLSFVNCKNVDNFMISDFNIIDNYSRLSSITVNLAEYNGAYFVARNGVVKNGDVVNGHVGYGLVQMQLGYNILYKNLSGQGGITLRMETGAVAGTPEELKIDNTYARHISCRNGSQAILMGSHTKQNGYVNVDGVRSTSCVNTISIGLGFVNEEEEAQGLKPGRFDSSSVVTNVHGIYGVNASIKSKNIKRVPCEVRHLISEEKIPDGASYRGPSIRVLIHKDIRIKATNISGEGYLYTAIIYIGEDDGEKNCP